MLYEHMIHVLEVLNNGPEMQTNLTEKVWGTSGRGNTTLTNALFPAMVDRNLVTMEQRGRAKVFAITDKGRQYIVDQKEIIEPLMALIDMPKGKLKNYRTEYDAWKERVKWVYINRTKVVNAARGRELTIEMIADRIMKSPLPIRVF